MSTSALSIPHRAATRPSRLLAPPLHLPGSRTRHGSPDPSRVIPAHPLSHPTPGVRLSELAVTVRRDATAMVLTPSGALDTYTVTAFRNVVERHDIACDDLVVDLDQVTLIDSAGLHTLRTLSNRVQASGHRLRLVCTRGDIRSALAIAGMTASFTVGGAEARVRCRPADQNATWIGRRTQVRTGATGTQAAPRTGLPSTLPVTAGATTTIRGEDTK